MKIKVNPLFFALSLALVAFGHALDFVWTMLALILHETAHALVARLRGFVVKKLVLLPYGAMMSTGESFDKTSSVLIGLAGPLCNLIVALILLGVWWLFPAVYPYTQNFLYCNLSLGLFNLLPVYPLDGSRVVLGVCKNKLRAQRFANCGRGSIRCAVGTFYWFVLFRAQFQLRYNGSVSLLRRDVRHKRGNVYKRA